MSRESLRNTSTDSAEAEERVWKPGHHIDISDNDSDNRHGNQRNKVELVRMLLTPLIHRVFQD